MPPLLYSTNAFLKYQINTRYRNGKHYVWCGETFDSSKVSRYHPAALTAPSSDPCAIYKRLREDVQHQDRHSEKIRDQKASYLTLAVKWRDAGEISPDDCQEIAYMVEHAPFDSWRPLIYVFPRQLVASRLQLVDPAQRASIGVPEYIVPDLSDGEFDLVEL